MQKLITCFTLVVCSACLLGQKIPLDQLQDMNIRSIGPAVTSGRVTSVDVPDHDPNTIYVGTASGGLWKSENGGMTWYPHF